MKPIIEEPDPDPIIEEIRVIRRKLMSKYKTMDAYFDHLDNLPSAADMHAKLKAKLARQEKRKAKRQAEEKVEV